MSRRRGTLIDGELLLLVGRRVVRLTMASTLPRFVFSPEASEEAGRVMREASLPIVARHRELQMPYDEFYVEIEWERFRHSDDPDAPRRVGYLYRHGILQVIVETDEKGPVIAPVEFAFDGAQRREIISLVEHAEHYAENAGVLYLGTTYEEASQELRDDVVSRIRAYTSARLGNYERAMQEQIGDVRNFWILVYLLGLPQTSSATLGMEAVPRWAGLVGNKRRVLPPMTVVSLRLDGQRPVVPQLGLRHHAPPRLHDVRGHYAHFGLERGCQHVWRALPEQPDHVARWTCEHCGGRRTWRRSHERGEGERIEHSYRVVTSQRGENQ